MLITVDKERERASVGPQSSRRPPREPRPVAPAKPATLWVVATVLTLVASGVAMSRITGFDFTLGLGPLRPPPVKALEPQLPYGKGMWIWQVNKTESGDVGAIISRAKEVGLTHLYVRMGSSGEGFYAGPFLNKILPAAHAAGIRVYGWDFPRLIDWEEDVRRATEAIKYETPTKQRIDGFAPDIETQSEGTHITAESGAAYSAGLRAAVGEGYPLIAVVPRPSAWTVSFFPYAEVVAPFDAVAPMVYWLNRYPGPDVEGALNDLKPLGKPVFPIGQAYDGAPEGGRPGVPPREELMTFADVAHGNGASGISFWSWQAADDQAWEAIKDVPHFKVGKGPSGPLSGLKGPASAPLAQRDPPGRSPLVLQAG